MTTTASQDTIKLARDFCKHYLRGQFRKGSNMPASSHSFEVATMLRKYGYDDPVTQCIAYLHDTVEDSKVRMDEIEEVFGFEISNGVYVLSRNTGKMIDRRKLNSQEYKLRIMFARNKVKRVKIADMIDNTCDLQNLSEESIDRKINDAAYFYIPIGLEICSLMIQELIGNIDNYFVKMGVVKK